MKPRRLELEGFTSFKEKSVLDFEGLDLFAITGATGAGKSSIIDAIVFALYGQIPRVGREYKQLISHGAERLSVRLDFEAGGRRYRVARTARVSGGAQTVLEREAPNGFESLAGRVKEIEEAIQGIVGLDYDAFTRSVVLPQGQFDAFLKGEPKERRKILVALLNLHVYEEMHQIANRRAADARREAEFLASLLASDFAGASPEALEACRTEWQAALTAKARTDGALAQVQDGLHLAEGVARDRVEVGRLTADIETEKKKIGAAEALRAEAGTQRSRLEQQLARLREQAGRASFDAERHRTLLGARPRAELLAELTLRIQRLDEAGATQDPRLANAVAELAKADAARPGLERRLEEAEGRVERAREEREAAHRQQAALALRRDLAPGEPCPVCEQPVSAVPRGPGAGLAATDDALKAALAVAQECRRALQGGEVAGERARGDLKRVESERSERGRQRDDLRAQARATGDALAEAGFKPLELTDPKTLLAGLVSELEGLHAAGRQRERLEDERRRLEAAASRLDADAAAAAGQVGAAKERSDALGSRLEAARASLVSGRAALGAMAGRAGWLLVAPAGGLRAVADQDEAVALRALRDGLASETQAAVAQIARLESAIERLEKDVARALELAEKRKGLEARAALAHTLAQHLRADQLLAYVQDEALRRLATDASRHLEPLSQQRYSLVVLDQEFAVVDHWSADHRRSVKTLSGGETFLASLALALALAESLASLGAEGRPGDALESLFLDEGFGSLDPEALGQVVQALDALQGGERMVGVVTHMPELAAQLPARIEVRREQGTAQILVV